MLWFEQYLVARRVWSREWHGDINSFIIRVTVITVITETISSAQYMLTFIIMYYCIMLHLNAGYNKEYLPGLV